MRVVKIKSENNCSMPLCNNKASYIIVANSLRGHGIYLCEKCKENLYNELAKHVVPKGIENVIVRANKRRKFYE